MPTKAQLVAELHSYGDMWANVSYSKAYLQQQVDDARRARTMTKEELLAEIKKRHGGTAC